MDSDGYVNLEDIMATQKFKGTTLAQVQEVLKGDVKGRLCLVLRKGAPNMYKIRATYGHSLPAVTTGGFNRMGASTHTNDPEVLIEVSPPPPSP
jgi:RNA:NAD 2'-phosphotransferase (TPT1/KptA family)